jgi:hypothetical protein
MMTILKKAMTLINKAQDDENFLSDNSDRLVGTGDSSAEYSAYCFELSDEYYLILDFVDFSLVDFSIVNRGHKKLMENL